MQLQDYCHIENGSLRLRRPLQSFSQGGIITDDEGFRSQLEMLAQASRSCVPLIIIGEKGSGKGQIARYVHSISERHQGPFIKSNFAYLPEGRMLEELFSAERSNFTLLERAQNGTLYLENVEQMSNYVQYRLIEQLNACPESIRLIVGLREPETHVPSLTGQLAAGGNTLTVEVPPLRKRKQDILLLTFQQLQTLRQDYHLERTVSRAVMSAMLQYDWPGNARQLSNIIDQMAFTSAHTCIDSVSLLQQCLHREEQLRKSDREKLPASGKSLKQLLQDYEILIIQQYVESYGSIRKAAEALQTSPATLSRRITEHNRLNGKNEQ